MLFKMWKSEFKKAYQTSPEKLDTELFGLNFGGDNFGVKIELKTALYGNLMQFTTWLPRSILH